MDPVRLHILLASAVHSARLTPALREGVYLRALQQCYARWPLAGCAVHYDGPTPQMIVVGRQ